MQTTKASCNQSSLSDKESAQGCIPKRVLGRPDEALRGGNQGPSAPGWGGSSTAGDILRVCPEIACQTGLLGALLQSRDLSMWCEAFPCAFSPSTAPVQGNQPLSRELLAVLCALSRAGSTPFPKVIRKGAGHTQRWEQASGFPLHVLEHLPPKLMSAYFLLCALTYTSDLRSEGAHV